MKILNDTIVEGREQKFSKEENIMTERVEKIARVARVNGVAHDNKHRFNSGRGRREETNTFAEELRRVMNKKSAPVKKTEIPEAYNLELTSCGTHSLFWLEYDRQRIYEPRA